MKRSVDHIYYLLPAVIVLGIFSSCTQYKNKFVNRVYHDVTTRYNGYFYARESLKEGVDKIETDYKEDYTELLPVFRYPDKDNVKSTFPQMDKAIKKASTSIQRHAIKDKRSKAEIPNTGHWIDDCWMIIGKAHFYKREFFPGIEAFEYVAGNYKSKQKEEAWVWLMKSYNELNALTQTDSYISLVNNDKKFPNEYKGLFEALYAEFYIKQGEGQYTQAIKHLEASIKKTKSKNTRARFYYLLGQLYEAKNKTDEARAAYKKTVKLKPATYELSFYAKMRQSLMSKDPASMEMARKELLKMTKDFKNSDLLDVIYYTLGQIDETEGKKDEAFDQYKLSVKKSVNNNRQKAKSYLKLADISFDNEEYVSASQFYDSTISLIKEDYPGYLDIKSKKTSLDSLVKNINIIKTEDSLQRVANMDTAGRNQYIRKIIKKVKADEAAEALKKQQAQLQNTGMPTNNAFTPQGPTNTSGPAQWYFYNALLKSQGLNDFVKKWGNQRKNEDNWRRSNKSSFTFDEVSAENSKDSTGKKGKDSLVLKSNDKHEVAYYLKNLPLTKSDRDTSDKKILEAYYQLGTIYRELLNNSNKSAQSFEAMNKRFPANKYEAPSYYQLYRIYIQQKNDPKASEAKSFLLSHYPNSDYSKIINDPDFAKSVNAKQSEVEAEYITAYDAYLKKEYAASYKLCSDALIKFGKSPLSPKYAYLKALDSGYLWGIDSLEMNMTRVTVKFAKSEVYEPARDVLEAIKKQKKMYEPKDTARSKDLPATNFTYNETAPHNVVILLNTSKQLEMLKTKVSDLNTEYFSPKNYEIIVLPKDNTTMVAIRTFANKDDAMDYYSFLLTKPDLFIGINKNDYTIFAISMENIGALLSSGKFDDYKAYFNAKYLGIQQ